MMSNGIKLFYRFYALLKKHDIHVEKNLDNTEYWLLDDKALNMVVCITYTDQSVDYIKIFYPIKLCFQFDEHHHSFNMSCYRDETFVDSLKDLPAAFDEFLRHRNSIVVLKNELTSLVNAVTTQIRNAAKQMSDEDLTALVYSKKREL